MTLPMLPHQIPDGPIDVTERVIKQMECPNPNCNSKLDVTNVNVGTKIQCKDCSNVTWLPDYKKQKWWQKPASFIAGILLSYVIGVGSSITASWLPGNKTPTDAPTTTGDNKNIPVTQHPILTEKNEKLSHPKF
ncbi:BRcat domain-containing protein [Klebsiella aerogenes]|jgi:hypothetical protein|uniref:BRcat domain-containing protein n=1 Tax=Enterobacteriaceae TaxID=543 RepID=UPI001033EF71|nr:MULTISPECIES: hypothetical protein [Enterobacteriaceae]MCS6067382.1 hypothetical protein [Klebsiella variicola subsp. variicola]MEA4536261.1 hypothetical protein [Klebsiella pneumoniae]WRR65200.1 hypothetical protein SPE70_09390 [Klebsiella sp. ZJOU C1]GKK06278.1 hypothetical protein NUKP38_04200 [Klebsiella variicola]HCP8905170.1 hypothetical protein [Escherichia coli]